MDELDSAIIHLLQADARLSNREIARRLGVAPSTALERIRSLTRRGVIRGYHADIDPVALNRGVQAIVSVKIHPSNRVVIDGFKAAARAFPEVVGVFVVSGAEDFILHVTVPSLEALHSFLADRLATRREVADFRSSVIFWQTQNSAPPRLPDA